MYRLIPCRHGVCASPSTAVTRALRKNKSTTGIEGVILLPGGIERDILAQDESIIFPGRISLDEDDIKNLDCLNPDNFSFTHYGPDSQDKSTNQDFALSGHFTGRSGGIARFSILADGISNGFAFPQRGAQLSCFAAYHCLKALYEQFAGQDKSLNEQNIDRFRDDLTEKINQFFKFDREHLLYLFEEDDREPPHIGPKAWQKYFKEKPEKWYGNTLLISFLSSFGGFLIYAGDGGIIVLKGQKPPKEIMRSSESPAVERFAAMGVTPAAFLGALIGRDPADGFVEIISVTDGIDRTWQTNEMDLARAFSAKASLAGLIDKIAHLQDRIPGGDIDVDNYSIGRVFLPFSAAPHSRMTGGAKPVPVSKSLLKPALEESQVDSDRIEAAAPQKKSRGMKKTDPIQILLGVALGVGLSNALIIGLAKIHNTSLPLEALSTEKSVQAKERRQAPATSEKGSSKPAERAVIQEQAAAVPMSQAAAAHQSQTTQPSAEASSRAARVEASPGPAGEAPHKP